MLELDFSDFKDFNMKAKVIDIHDGNIFINSMNRELTERGYKIKEVSESRISARKYYPDEKMTLYAYVYTNRYEKFVSYDKEGNTVQSSQNGPCLIMYLNGPGVKTQNIENVELKHIFNPKVEDIAILEEVAESLIILLR